MAVTPTQAPATAAGPEIKDPTLTQQLMLDAPFGDDLCVISARGTGKSLGIVMLVARDAAHWKERYSCLITRTTYQGLTELQGLLWRYLSVAFPGTTYSGGDMTFRVGGKDMPFGRVELAYTGAGPAEQVRALARLQGRSFICAIHDEVGNHFDAGPHRFLLRCDSGSGAVAAGGGLTSGVVRGGCSRSRPVLVSGGVVWGDESPRVQPGRCSAAIAASMRACSNVVSSWC